MLNFLLCFLAFILVRVDGTWIVAQVKEINWQQNCIQDRNCESMELSLVLDSNSVEGSTQSSWHLNDVLKNPQNSQMFVYWISGSELTNITLKSLLTANDVLFNIPRPCDLTSALHIFGPMIKTSAYNAPSSSDSNQVETDKKQTIGLVGKCFHVIVEVRLYIQNCPWCSLSSTVKNSNLNSPISTPFDKLFESPEIMASILFLICLVLIGLIVCYTTHKLKTSNRYQQQQYSSSTLSEMAFKNRAQMNISKIPLPSIRPPAIPDQIHHKIHDGSICPYYETLDNHILQNQKSHGNSNENYDSAFGHSFGDSPNSSFSGPNLSDSGQGSPQQLPRPRSDYV